MMLTSAVWEGNFPEPARLYEQQTDNGLRHIYFVRSHRAKTSGIVLIENLEQPLYPTKK